eukprot:6403239-Alexandrium_andersonii.AAC.1
MQARLVQPRRSAAWASTGQSLLAQASPARPETARPRQPDDPRQTERSQDRPRTGQTRPSPFNPADANPGQPKEAQTN